MLDRGGELLPLRSSLAILKQNLGDPLVVSLWLLLFTI